MFIEVDHPLAGKYKTVNNPIKFSLTPVRGRHQPRRSGSTAGRYSPVCWDSPTCRWTS